MEEIFTHGEAHKQSHLEFASLKAGVKPHPLGQVCYRFEVRKSNRGFPVEKVSYRRVDGSGDWHETGRQTETVFEERIHAVDSADMQQGHEQNQGEPSLSPDGDAATRAARLKPGNR